MPTPLDRARTIGLDTQQWVAASAIVVAIVIVGVAAVVAGPVGLAIGLILALVIGLLPAVVWVRIGRERLDALAAELSRVSPDRGRSTEVFDPLTRVERLVADLPGSRSSDVTDLSDLVDPAATGRLVANLADQIRHLADRQLPEIAWLEGTEQDPERLRHLFELDHLVNQIRRITETTVIAGGGAPTTYTGDPTTMLAAIRVAIGSVADYRRVRVAAVDHALVPGQLGLELATLVGALVDNACRFSHPSELVTVTGTVSGDATFRITIADQGSGMGPAELVAANQTVSAPPLIDSEGAARLGLIAVGRIARQVGVAVQLSAIGGRGTAAEITVPQALLLSSGPSRERRQAPSALAGGRPDRATPSPSPWPGSAPTPGAGARPAAPTGPSPAARAPEMPQPSAPTAHSPEMPQPSGPAGRAPEMSQPAGPAGPEPSGPTARAQGMPQPAGRAPA
ncbi:MAG: ATP-binding protein, partial [Acidimicrobiales bacterium]